MLEKMEIVRQIARTDSSVLLFGEAGVGKELIAEQIHLKSDYADAPFVCINCAVQNLNALDDLNSGTLFLDEISVLTLELQTELLTALKTKTENSKNFRIIASTKGDLETMVEEGKFIRELYYQLNVLPIYIPPLRQRTEDILPLARYFLEIYMVKIKRYFDGFTEDAAGALCSASWKGNVRELKNSIERACFTAQTQMIDEQALFEHFNFQYTGRVGEGKWDLKDAVDTFKTRFIEQALEEHSWNQTSTAQALGIQRTYLSKLIKELQIKKGA